MGIAEDMGRIAENIITSYDVRVKALGDLVADTHKTLKGFASDRKKMGAEQAKSLADFVKNLTKNVDGMLARFQREHKEMKGPLLKSLSDFVTDLTRNVSSMMKGIQSAHKEMAVNLRADLEKGEADRLKEFKSMMTGIQKGIREIETYVANKLKEFGNAHADMSEALKRELAKYVGDIVSTVKKLLGEYSSDMAKAKRAWEGMSSTMAKARKTGAVPKIEAGAKVTPIKKAKLKKRLPKLTRKQKDIFTVVRENPDGITLPEIAYAMGVPFVTLARDAKKLLDLKVTKKRDNRYYPA